MMLLQHRTLLDAIRCQQTGARYSDIARQLFRNGEHDVAIFYQQLSASFYSMARFWMEIDGK